jgi:hypothetical protein
MALTLDGTNGIVSSGSITTQSATGVIFSDSSSLPAASSPYVLKNRIINGDMRIDQRNAGASVTAGAGSGYTVDRWAYAADAASKFSIQQSSTAPTGFSYSVLLTSLSAYTPTSSQAFQFRQAIEGYNMADWAWGTANAKTVTLSFWVRSSLTGNFGGSIVNDSENRCYAFSYTISAANTWEQKSITIAGPTDGTWGSTNGTGLRLVFSVGMGSTFTGTANTWNTSTIFQPTGSTNLVSTNGATLYISGVQLEQNTSATPFERRLYNQELANCQRYFCLLAGGGACGVAESSTRVSLTYQYPVPMRGSPTGTLDATKGTLNQPSTGPNSITTMNNFAFGTATSETGGWLLLDTSTSSWTAGRVIINAGTTGMIKFSAEL